MTIVHVTSNGNNGELWGSGEHIESINCVTYMYAGIISGYNLQCFKLCLHLDICDGGVEDTCMHIQQKFNYRISLSNGLDE